MDAPRTKRRHRYLLGSHYTEIRALRAQGTPIKVLQDRFNRSSAVILYHTRDIPPPEGGWHRAGAPTRYDRAQAHALRDQGKTHKQIAEALGCSTKTAYRLLSGWQQAPCRRPDQPLGRLVRMVAQVTGHHPSEIRQSQEGSKATSRELSLARHIAFWLARWHLGLSRHQIADRLGFCQTSVRYGLKMIDRLVMSLKPPLPRHRRAIALLLFEQTHLPRLRGVR